MEAAAEKARIEQEAANKRKMDEEAKLRQEREAAEAADAAKREAEAVAKREADAKASTPKAKLGQYFNAISAAPNVTAANSNINEALAMFTSGDTPVLIIISGEGAQKDYDKPTTISTYLNYLKDQKKNINRIENLVFDNYGKISEVELRKN
ncbi:hypothetical protein BH09BAC3_BH09BAC3_29360 [soil metagenome]